jgi:Predicted phosphoadenosine phosphosulfate sulfotransferase
MDCQWKIPVGL